MLLLLLLLLLLLPSLLCVVLVLLTRNCACVPALLVVCFVGDCVDCYSSIGTSRMIRAFRLRSHPYRCCGSRLTAAASDTPALTRRTSLSLRGRGLSA
eukprot:COSAG05_NODE_3294_length_2172_cov_0.968644_2_plen_98_part_00